MSRIDDGFSTTISFASATSGLEVFWEKEVTPPGISGGGEIDTTTMQNTTWRTKWPKSLKTMTEGSITVSYDPDIYDEIVSMLGDNQLITITFPGTETLAFYGFIDSFSPNAIVEGEQPTAEIVMIPTNQTDLKVETAPAMG